MTQRTSRIRAIRGPTGRVLSSTSAIDSWPAMCGKFRGRRDSTELRAKRSMAGQSVESFQSSRDSRPRSSAGPDEELQTLPCWVEEQYGRAGIQRNLHQYRSGAPQPRIFPAFAHGKSARYLVVVEPPLAATPAGSR